MLKNKNVHVKPEPADPISTASLESTVLLTFISIHQHSIQSLNPSSCSCTAAVAAVAAADTLYSVVDLPGVLLHHELESIFTTSTTVQVQHRGLEEWGERATLHFAWRRAPEKLAWRRMWGLKKPFSTFNPPTLSLSLFALRRENRREENYFSLLHKNIGIYTEERQTSQSNRIERPLTVQKVLKTVLQDWHKRR